MKLQASEQPDQKHRQSDKLSDYKGQPHYSKSLHIISSWQPVTETSAEFIGLFNKPTSTLMFQMVMQHQYSISNAMEALEKPCELPQVFSECYDLILSHCITRGLNYII